MKWGYATVVLMFSFVASCFLTNGVVHGQNSIADCSDGALRLVNTIRITAPNAGRVEVCLNRVWGTIAADLFDTPWSDKNAQVACRQMGFESGALNSILQNTTSVTDRPDNSVPVHYRNVRCDGTEPQLVECALNRVNEPMSHILDVFIVCQPRTIAYSDLHQPGPRAGDIRLLGTPLNGAGAVEIYTNEIGWTGICPDADWTDADAATICRAFGYNSGMSNNFEITNGTIPQRLATNAMCDNSGLVRDTSPILAGPCSLAISDGPVGCIIRDKIYAGVICSNNNPPSSIRFFGNLMLDNSDNRPSGIVEILYNNRWGLICRDFFIEDDNNFGRVVCQELGHDKNIDAARLVEVNMQSPQRLMQESSLKPIWLSNVVCSEASRNVSTCPSSSPVGYAGCTSGSIIAVQCGAQSGELSAGAIVGIVIGSLVGIGILLLLIGHWNEDAKKKRAAQAAAVARQQNRQQTSQQNAVAQSIPNPEPASATRQSDDSDSEPEEVREARRSSLTKAPPPSYNKSANYEAPQPDAPPPYPGGPGPYPPPSVGFNLSYLPSAVAGPTDFAYPPTTVTGDHNYPPQTSGEPGENLAYPLLQTPTISHPTSLPIQT